MPKFRLLRGRVETFAPCNLEPKLRTRRFQQ